MPPGLDWDLWLGPAPWAPFTPLRSQAHPWYHISDSCMGFIACVRDGRRTCAPVEAAHRSTTLCTIAATSVLVRRKLVWDADREIFAEDDEAKHLLSRAMRAPWRL